MTAGVERALDPVDEPESHEWAFRSVEFEDVATINVFECKRCGAIDYRDAAV